MSVNVCRCGFPMSAFLLDGENKKKGYKTMIQKYYIEKFRYLELYYFCLQYDEKKRRIGNAEDEAEKSRLKKDIEMMDTALLLAADSEIVADCIKKNVTSKNMPWEKLNVPIGRRQFYEKRRKFFWILNRLTSIS